MRWRFAFGTAFLLFWWVLIVSNIGICIGWPLWWRAVGLMGVSAILFLVDRVADGDL